VASLVETTIVVVVAAGSEGNPTAPAGDGRCPARSRRPALSCE